jgi:HK97 family phage portal protein
MFKSLFGKPKLSELGDTFSSNLKNKIYAQSAYPVANSSKYGFLDKSRDFLANILQRKVNNSGVTQGLPLWSTGDKPVLYSSEAVLYYLECAPVATAVDKIAMDVASIPPLIYSKKHKEFICEHPVLELLQSPNTDITFTEFMHSLSSWYLISGNSYINGTGYIENPPKEIRVYPSQSTSIIVGIDGYAQNYTARLLGLVDTFNRTEVINYGRSRFRFYANEFKELYHIRTFNPQVSSNMAYGLSPLNAIYYEMRQYIEAAKYNLSVLERQSKLSGIFKTKTVLMPEMRKRLETQMQNMYSGSTNAGRNMLIDGTDMEFQDLMVGGRDMDYVKMREQVTKSIYKALKIPLPLVSEESMTYSNLEGAKILYYKQSVLPLRRRIDEELTNFLMPRYDNKDNDLIITFNEHDVPAMESDRNEQAKIKKDIGIFTPNELRKLFAYTELEGGQNLYGKFGDTPIAVDTDDKFHTGEELDKPEPSRDNEMPHKPADDGVDTYVGQGQSDLENDIDLEPDLSDDGKKSLYKKSMEDYDEYDLLSIEDKKKIREKYIGFLRKQKYRNNKPKYSEDEINDMALTIYGPN